MLALDEVSSMAPTVYLLPSHAITTTRPMTCPWTSTPSTPARLTSKTLPNWHREHMRPPRLVLDALREND
ncbi:hypothetical protein GSI_04976 [Ganoderma sinense ZZ0214-1]|uniref:Uncharacterized protein n=1 Tax=Ganoderma sinense ZZ0214-1 TaxID=1077348 RepID=A0A2G8SGG3_9APHY|nr:hypothetical protein GSI_04976 [Ganoderma sinense ZZ0214-1]